MADKPLLSAETAQLRKQLSEGYARAIVGVTGIREQIRMLSSCWINVDYSRAVEIPTQIKDLCVHAFINRIPEGVETDVLREAYKQLEQGAVGGEYVPVLLRETKQKCQLLTLGYCSCDSCRFP